MVVYVNKVKAHVHSARVHHAGKRASLLAPANFNSAKKKKKGFFLHSKQAVVLEISSYVLLIVA